MFNLQLENLLNSTYSIEVLKANPETKFQIAIILNGKTHHVKVSIEHSSTMDASRLGNDIINYILNFNKYYNEIISMCNTWCRQFVEREGGVGNSPLFNDDPIDATREFSLRQINISQTEASAIHDLDNKKYKYDCSVWFTNWNDDDRGFEARFYKGKLVAVELAS